MGKCRLLAAATVLALSLIAPTAILAEEPGPDPTGSAGAVTAPEPEPGAGATNPADEPSADDPVTDEPGSGDPAVGEDPSGDPAAGEGPGGNPAVGDAAVATTATVEAQLLAAERRAPASASATPAATVAIQDYFFSPKTVTIDAGETVRWNNKGEASEGHTVTGDSFDSGVLKQGGTYSHKFSKTGTFDYFCELHPNMTGKVVVKSASGGGGSGGGGSNDGGTTDPDNSGSGSGSASSLPYTGQDLRVVLVVGINLMLAGLLLLLRSRHRAHR